MYDDDVLKGLRESWSELSEVDSEDSFVMDLNVGITALPRFMQLVSKLSEELDSEGIRVSLEKPKGFIKGLGSAEFNLYFDGPSKAIAANKSRIMKFVEANVN